jgi:hypothetical protein
MIGRPFLPFIIHHSHFILYLMKYPLAIITAAAAVVAAIIRSVIGDPPPATDPDAASPVPPITARQVENFAVAGGTDAEIADRFLKDPEFVAREYADVLRVARAQRKLHLRVAQFALAKKLNSPMLIWLGRNVLWQSNQPTEEGEAMPEVLE